MKNSIFSFPIFAIVITCFTMVACSEKAGTSAPQASYILEMDFEDWLLRQAVWPANARVQLLAHEAAELGRGGATHPIDRLAQATEAHAWTDSLPIWFPDILYTTTGDASIPKLRHAFDSAILLAAKSASLRLQDACEIIVQNDGRIQITTSQSSVSGDLRSLLQLEGRLGFYETWNYDEVIAGIQKMREATLKIEDGDTVFDVVRLSAVPKAGLGADGPEFGFSAHRPVVWFAKTTDTATVGQIFRDHSDNGAFPSQIRFAWTSTALEQDADVFELVALKTMRNGKPRLEGSAVKHAMQDFEPSGSSPMVSIEMHQEGAREWSRMTRSNLERCIAIVFDGTVSTFPTVQGEITGGRSQITGNFTVTEAKTLATILSSGAYPARMRILEGK